jgi:diguanylate cyclase (GGDEF)-like protein/PAS domain S-box-containing protein
MKQSRDKLQGNQSDIHLRSSISHRSRPLSVLFVHRDADRIDSCVNELEAAQFVVRHDFVPTLEQCTKLLLTQSYDVVIAENPGLDRKEVRSLQLLQETMPEIPLLLLTTSKDGESLEPLNADGNVDYVEQRHLAQLPMAVRRLLSHKKLRADLEDARTALRHSQSLYRALADNPAYGIYRCDAEGILLDVNQALATMLGFSSKEELLAANQELELIPRPRPGPEFSARSDETKRIHPVEVDWKRKDGTTLKARLSGHGVYDHRENFAGYEIIAVDVTEQRTLEDQLRHQASSDFLTGLGNHRRLFEALHMEVCRSGRSGREFSLLLLDLDGLKKINDEFGHPVGSRALCRLAQILADCCRSIDTAARHGGDEFAVVLPETTKTAAASIARRICDVLRNETEEPALSVSVGIASYPHDGDTTGTLVCAADNALYAMKSKSTDTINSASASLSYRMDSHPGCAEMPNDVNSKLKEVTPHG